METKRFITVIALSMLVLFGWNFFVQWYTKTHAPPTAVPQSTPQTAPASGPATLPLVEAVPTTGATTGPGATPGTTQAATQGAPPQVSNAAVLQVTNPGDAAQSAGELGSADPKSNYSLQVQFSGLGGGIEGVVLNQYHEPVQGKELYRFQTPSPLAPDASRLMATRSLTIREASGRERSVDLASALWRRDKASEASPQSACYTATVGDPAPLLDVSKVYTVYPKDNKDHPGGYEVAVEYTFANRTDAALSVKSTFNGVSTPPRELERGGDRTVMVGFYTGKTVDIKRTPIEEFAKDRTRQDVSNHDKNYPMTWAGAASAYFNATVQPWSSEGKVTQDVLAKATATLLNPDQPDMDLHEVATTLETRSFDLPAGGKATVGFNLFLGPRDRQLLDAAPYNQLPRNYFETLNTASGPCGWCTFSWLVAFLSGLLNVFHFVVRDWGLAIIGLVVLVRVLLHPISKKSQISMQKMQKMQPEIERLKKKFGDNKEELNKAMMEMYKETGVAPLLGCLPMFLQMPIWIALYSSLQTNIQLRQAPFLWDWTWIHNLAQPDKLWAFKEKVPLIFGLSLSAVNLLPILMAVVMAIQAQMMKPPTLDPQQAQTQKMMQWMSPIMFLLFLYNGPSGLNLYIMTSTAIGIIESKVVRDHIKAAEEAEKAGRVLVDARPTRAGKRLAEDAKKEKEQPQKEGWLARLQRMAEEARNEAQKRKKK